MAQQAHVPQGDLSAAVQAEGQNAISNQKANFIIIMKET